MKGGERLGEENITLKGTPYKVTLEEIVNIAEPRIKEICLKNAKQGIDHSVVELSEFLGSYEGMQVTPEFLNLLQERFEDCGFEVLVSPEDQSIQLFVSWQHSVPFPTPLVFDGARKNSLESKDNTYYLN